MVFDRLIVHHCLIEGSSGTSTHSGFVSSDCDDFLDALAALGLSGLFCTCYGRKM